MTPDEAVADLFNLERILSSAPLKDELSGEPLQTVYEGIKDNFETEQDPSGKPWAPLKSRREPPPKLVETTRMRSAATGEPLDEGDMIQDIGDRHITVGIRGDAVPYAHVHQDGSSRVPQRKFLGLSSDWIRELGSSIAGGLNKLVRNRRKG
jgi:phage gpG-like protein